MPSTTRRRPTKSPSFAAPYGAEPPRQLPTEDDPTRQPMPERPPLDPPVNPAPDAPPNGDHDSGPLTDTPASSLPHPDARTGSPLHRPKARNPLGQSMPDLWHASPPRDPEDDDDNGADDEDEVDEPNEPDPGEPADLPEKAALPVSPPIGGNVRYESRIQILDAFQYQGSMKQAPDWIDRNWIGYASDEDSLRNIPAGPCLRVPSASGDIVLCRIGDFVARQEIRLAQDLPGDIRIEVWAQEQFFKLFLPVSEKPFRPFNPPVIEHEATA